MKKYIIWVEKDEQIVEFPDDWDDARCKSDCEDILDGMLGNIDSGFNEIVDEKEK